MKLDLLQKVEQSENSEPVCTPSAETSVLNAILCV